MRGGMSYLANRYVNANNKYMKNYDKKTLKYIMYLDANNLYGCVMSQFYQVVDLNEWLKKKLKN